MSPSATPATQKAAASTATAGNRARHQSQPSAIRATPATLRSGVWTSCVWASCVWASGMISSCVWASGVMTSLQVLITQLVITPLAHTQLDIIPLTHTQFAHTQLVHTPLLITPLVITPLVFTLLVHTELTHTQLVITSHHLSTRNLSSHYLSNTSWCMDKLWVTGGWREEAADGMQNQNKNPTQRCGEKPVHDSIFLAWILHETGGGIKHVLTLLVVEMVRGCNCFVPWGSKKM